MNSQNQNNLLEERQQKACFQLRETVKKLHSFKMLYHQTTYAGADQLLMQMVDVWIDFAIASLLKILQILDVGEASVTSH